jgi:serine/threonine protein kinase
MARPTELDLRPGARPVPDYVLVKKLGQGGFGQVWMARDGGGFEVALKFLRLDDRASPELRALEVMKNVRHAHLLPMFRSWLLGEWLVLALELGDKTAQQRLQQEMDRGGAGIPVAELLEYLREAAKGLDYLHSLSIQHRDVKPHNLLLVGGSLKVADFGLAKLVEQSRASHSGSMTVAYAAPEQFNGEVSPHSDQYSLAVTYCQLRGGRLPFRGSHTEVVYGHTHGEPDLSMVPPAERPAVSRALSKQPDRRWGSCAEFAEAVSRAAGGLPPDLATTRPLPGWLSGRTRAYALAGALVLLAALVAAVVSLHRPATPSETGARNNPPTTAGAPPAAPTGAAGGRGGLVAGARVRVTKETEGFEDNHDNQSLRHPVVHEGTEAEVLKLDRARNLCLIRMDNPNGDEVWVSADAVSGRE